MYDLVNYGIYLRVYLFWIFLRGRVLILFFNDCVFRDLKLNYNYLFNILFKYILRFYISNLYVFFDFDDVYGKK